MGESDVVKVFDVRELCRALRASIQEQPNGAANPILDLLIAQEEILDEVAPEHDIDQRKEDDILDAVAAELDIEQRKEDEKACEGGPSRERQS